MDLAVYRNSWLVPAKCGTRYLDELFDIKNQINFPYLLPNGLPNGLSDDTKILINEKNINPFFVADRITHIVLREPLSHLHSALHTELWGHIPETERVRGLNLDNEFIMNRLRGFLKGNQHWSPTLYKKLWNNISNKNITIINLNDLNVFVKSSLGWDIPYEPQKYNHPEHRLSRDTILGWVKTDCADIYNDIIKLMELDMVYYNKILKAE